MRKLISIFLGWWFLVTNQNNPIAKYRLKICSKCELREGILCSVCGCALVAKARLTGNWDDGCPVDKWPAKK